MKKSFHTHFRLFAATAALIPSIALTATRGDAFTESNGTRLDMVDNVRMVQSMDRSYRPFFRMRLVISQGVAQPVTPSESIEIIEGEHRYRPFSTHFETPDGMGSTGQPPTARFVLVLFDVSGSMLDRLAGGQSKFEAAKAAVRRMLSGFQDGVDNVSFVPFESHNVWAKVRHAPFADTRTAVEAQIASLPQPEPTGNTGLYTAVKAALTLLNDTRSENGSSSITLIVLTDGKNDVHPEKGDDPDLLGNEALQDIAETAKNSGFTIWTIGFGDTDKAIDTKSLKALASPDHYRPATNLKSLDGIFREARLALINEFRVTFATDWQDARALTGTDVRFRVRMRTGDGHTLESDPIRFATPQSAPPSFVGMLTPEEEDAWVRAQAEHRRAMRAADADESGASPFQDVLLSRLLILAGSSLLLALLWFALPRAIWSGTNSKWSDSIPASSFRPLINNPAAGVTAQVRPPTPNTAARPSESPHSSAASAGHGFAGSLSHKPRRRVDHTVLAGARDLDPDPWGYDASAPPGKAD